MMKNPSIKQPSSRARELLDERSYDLHRRIDHVFAYLLAAQWLGSIILARFVTPYAWAGLARSTHPHVIAAIGLGAIITLLPITLIVLDPGSRRTRHVIAVSQMLWSSMLIHLTGGRIESHFHIFGSLAFLAFYRDASVLVPATLVTAADHLLRQLFWPESFYGITDPEWWRFLEHSGWVLFEVAFLALSCFRGSREMRLHAEQQAAIEETSLRLDEALTAAMKAQAEAEQANEVKSQFLAHMSHELRTPINGMMGLAEILSMSSLDERQLRYVGSIRAVSETLLGLVNDVLDFSRGQAGKVVLQDLPFDPAALVHEVASVFTPNAELKSVVLRSELDADLPAAIRGDAPRLRQVLSNLVANAVKFTNQGEVVVRASQSSSDETTSLIRIEVRDSGIGISKKEAEGLFQPFAQVDASNTRRYGGTGLGLAISKQLIEQMGGEIGLVSEPGVGSTFWFTLRAERTNEAPSESTHAQRAPRSPIARKSKANKKRILVAEDNAVNREVAAEMLALLGHEAHFVHDGSAAIEAVSSERFDLLLMNCQMPVLDGYEATRMIRALAPPACEVPILALTAHVRPEEHQKTRSAGMNALLSKPYALADLARSIESLTSKNDDDRNIDEAANVETGAARAHDAGVLDPSVSRSPRVRAIYLRQLSEFIPALRSALASDDHASIKALAHKLAGGSAMIGATTLMNLCRAIEHDTLSARAKLVDLESATTNVSNALKLEANDEQ